MHVSRVWRSLCTDLFLKHVGQIKSPALVVWQTLLDTVHPCWPPLYWYSEHVISTNSVLSVGKIALSRYKEVYKAFVSQWLSFWTLNFTLCTIGLSRRVLKNRFNGALLHVTKLILFQNHVLDSLAVRLDMSSNKIWGLSRTGVFMFICTQVNSIQWIMWHQCYVWFKNSNGVIYGLISVDSWHIIPMWKSSREGKYLYNILYMRKHDKLVLWLWCAILLPSFADDIKYLQRNYRHLT